MDLQPSDKDNEKKPHPSNKNMSEPDTLVETLESLQEQGYTYDFNMTAHALELHKDDGIKLTLSPEDFDIVKVYRFEGMTNPSDMSILYAIESKDGLKGTLVSSYGVYADAMSAEMIKKLDTRSSLVVHHSDDENAN
jgi:protease II